MLRRSFFGALASLFFIKPSLSPATQLPKYESSYWYSSDPGQSKVIEIAGLAWGEWELEQSSFWKSLVWAQYKNKSNPSIKRWYLIDGAKGTADLAYHTLP